MLTLPKIVDRPEIPYLAVRAEVTLPFVDEIPALLGRLFGAMAERGIAPAGPLIFKHNVIDMPWIEMDFAVPVSKPESGGGPLVAGVLPAGRYAEITWFGPYDDLIDVNAVLIGWARHCGLDFDMQKEPAGDRFAGRVEIYHNDPDTQPDPAKLETTVAIRLRD